LAVDQVNSQLNKHNPQNRPQATDRLKTDEKPDVIWIWANTLKKNKCFMEKYTQNLCWTNNI